MDNSVRTPNSAAPSARPGIRTAGPSPERQPAPASDRGWHFTLNAPLVLGFAALCCIAFVLSLISGGATDLWLFACYQSSFADPFTYLRFFTHVFGHSSFEHLAGNMAFILLLGPLLEEKYGWKKLLGVILITAFACGIINFVLFPGQAIMGASGVVFAFILLASFTDAQKGEIPITFLLVAVIFLGQQIYQGFFVADNVSQLSHIIGGIVGAVAGFALVSRGNDSGKRP